MMSVRNVSSLSKGKSANDNPVRYIPEHAEQERKQSRTHAAAEKSVCVSGLLLHEE